MPHRGAPVQAPALLSCWALHCVDPVSRHLRQSLCLITPRALTSQRKFHHQLPCHRTSPNFLGCCKWCGAELVRLGQGSAVDCRPACSGHESHGETKLSRLAAAWTEG